MNDLLHDAARRADRYLASLHTRSVAPTPEAIARLALRQRDLPEKSSAADSSTPDFFRRARGIDVWAALRQLGREGLADLVERTCRHAARFAHGLSDAGYRVLNDVVLNQVMVSFGSAERTRDVITRIQSAGTCWCGGTVWQGQTAMRISVCSWATTDADVEQSLEAILRAARG